MTEFGNPWGEGGQYRPLAWETDNATSVPAPALEPVTPQQQDQQNDLSGISGNYSLGLDISWYQQGIDWDKINDEVIWKGHALGKVSFIYIKVTQGLVYQNSLALNQAQNAVKNNIPIGYYHFAEPVVGSAIKEAKYFNDATSDLPNASLFPMLDFEWDKMALTKQEAYDWINEFFQNVDSVLLYSGQPYLNEHLPENHDLGRLTLWLSNYNPESQVIIPSGWSDWSIWQFAGEEGRHPAFNGPVDMDLAKKIPFYY